VVRMNFDNYFSKFAIKRLTLRSVGADLFIVTTPESLRTRRTQGGLQFGFVLVRKRGLQDFAAYSLQLL
jgi:hypothetical protein